MDYESAFLIRNQDKIISKLAVLHKNKWLLTAYFGDRGESFITTILDIYVKNNILVFYHSPKQGEIDKLLKSPLISFKTEYLGTKVAFEATKLVRVEHQGIAVFAIPIPDSILWIEARDFHRIRLPESKASCCHFLSKEQDPIRLKLHDISLVGFSVLNVASAISMQLVPQAHFEECTLSLADLNQDTIAFEVRNKQIINRGKPNRMEKIGCRFTRISPEFKNVILNFMQVIERENRDLKLGKSAPVLNLSALK